MSSQCTIYEFSTGLIKSFQESQGKWISQGFTGKLEDNNCPIPEKLQNAISRGYFSVDESLAYYNSESEQLIVVLKTIDEYSVLAVGRRETDDAYRPFLAFRYFWLSTPNNTNIDGLGTLLLWWLQAGKPHFEFSGTPNEPQLTQPCTGIDLEQDNLEGNSVRAIKKIIFLDEQRIITSINIDSILINPYHEYPSLITQALRNNSNSTIFFAQVLSDKIQEFITVFPYSNVHYAPHPPVIEINLVPAPPQIIIKAPKPPSLSAYLLAIMIIIGSLTIIIYGVSTYMLKNAPNSNLENNQSPKLENLD